MFSGTPFYHASVRRYVAAFGAVFQNVKIDRESADGTILKTISVPLSYGPKAKRTNIKDGRNDRGVSQILPRMSFSLDNMVLDTNRKTNKLNKHKHSHPVGTDKNWSFSRVPYVFSFRLALKAKSMEDMLRMVEPMMAYFDPSITINIEDIDQTKLDINQNIEIKLTGIEKNDDWDGDIEDTRIIEWVLDFELYGFVYKRISTDPIILTVNITDWDEALQRATQVLTSAVYKTNGNEYVEYDNDLYTEVQRDLFDAAGSSNANRWGLE
ncbi:MAG: tail sheath stabilizer and completion protein [Candidatus Peribacteraceae bacterium]|nr:tail sheath stabilizer and completion protein [Candidatus Peribacteraceae bacterium]